MEEGIDLMIVSKYVNELNHKLEHHIHGLTERKGKNKGLVTSLVRFRADMGISWGHQLNKKRPIHVQNVSS